MMTFYIYCAELGEVLYSSIYSVQVKLNLNKRQCFELIVTLFNIKFKFVRFLSFRLFGVKLLNNRI